MRTTQSNPSRRISTGWSLLLNSSSMPGYWYRKSGVAGTNFSRFRAEYRRAICRWYWWRRVETDRPVRWGYSICLSPVGNRSSHPGLTEPDAWYVAATECRAGFPAPVSDARHFLGQSKEICRAGKTFQFATFNEQIELHEFYPFIWPIVVHRETVMRISHCLLFFLTFNTWFHNVVTVKSRFSEGKGVIAYRVRKIAG